MAGLYVHIPFCHSKCIYCDFYSTPRREDVDAVVDGLISEFKHRCREISEPFETIYFGGGTPSILSPSQFEILCEVLPIKSAKEFTIEVNPEDVSDETVRVWKACGVNRISMGVQTLNDDVLRKIGRRHSSRQVYEAINSFTKHGITNISLDLIYGLPGIDQSGWEDDLNRTLSLPIKHLSAYCLTYHEGTMLYKMAKTGRVLPMDEDETVRRFEALRAITAEHGFEHYEISNFARKGFRSRHNSSYWNPRSKWLGLGPSAHSFDGHTRRIDIPDIKTWLQKLPAPYEIDEENDLDRINDNIVTALRTIDGIDLDTIPPEFRSRLLLDARPYIERGNMVLTDTHLSIPPSQWLMSDSYIRDLIILDE